MNLLYVLCITRDMQSMGRGKSVAHAAHAANHFTFNSLYVPQRDGLEIPNSVLEWHESANGFGTTIALDVGSVNDLISIISNAQYDKHIAQVVVDPEYPYLVDSELVEMIGFDHHTKPPIQINDNQFLCHRKQITCGYIFGDKNALYPYVGKLNLLRND